MTVRLVAGTQVVRKLRRAIRPKPAPPVPDAPLPGAPRDRREAVWSQLAPHLAAIGVSTARADPSTGAAAAVAASQLSGLHQALLRAAATRPDLQAHLYRANRGARPVRLGSLRLPDLEKADRLAVGSSWELSEYRIGLDGHLTVLIVEHDPQRNRLLARHNRAERVDWTGLLGGESLTAVGAGSPHAAAPIDVVYTWVDSTDPEWREQHTRHSGDLETNNVSANNRERYVDRDELRHSLRSVWMFAPFVRHIYLVTADQRPHWLRPHPKIRVVSHREIFPDSAVLPTFNSHAIEACLHRIPGLSENFLYFNDDVFLGRETTEADFFTQAGLAKVRLSPSAFIYQGAPEPDAIPTDWAAYNSISLIERDFSMSFDRRLLHVPLPLHKSVLQEIDDRYPDEVGRTRAARLRSTSDIAIPSMFGQYYGIVSRRAVEWPHRPDDYVYLNTGRAHAARRYEKIMTRHPMFFCLNATRYDDIDLGEQATRIGEFLTTVFPVAAPWENDD